MFKSQSTENLLEVSVNSMSQNIRTPGDGDFCTPRSPSKGGKPLRHAEGEELGDASPQTVYSTRRSLRETAHGVEGQ